MTSIFYRMLHIVSSRDDKSHLHAKETEITSLEEDSISLSSSSSSSSSSTAENTNKTIHISNYELQEKLKRVTRKDIAEVTKEDVNALKAFLLQDRALSQDSYSNKSKTNDALLSSSVDTDIENIDLEKLRMSMEYLLQSNKFVDVLVCASSDTWKEAASGLTLSQLRVFDNLIQKRWGYLHSVLPFINTQFLEVMREYVNENASAAHSTL